MTMTVKNDNTVDEKLSFVGDELNELYNAYEGLRELSTESDAPFNHAFYILDTINKRLSKTIEVFFDSKRDLRAMNTSD